MQLANQLDHQLVPSFFEASQSAEILSNQTCAADKVLAQSRMSSNVTQHGRKQWCVRVYISGGQSQSCPSERTPPSCCLSCSLAQLKKTKIDQSFSMEVYKLGWKQQTQLSVQTCSQDCVAQLEVGVEHPKWGNFFKGLIKRCLGIHPCL